MAKYNNTLPIGVKSHIQFLSSIEKDFGSVLPSTIIYRQARQGKSGLEIDDYSISAIWLKAKCFEEMKPFLEFTVDDFMNIEKVLLENSISLDNPVVNKVRIAIDTLIISK